jgi:molybdopterin/thiamine biosynthesis adenylyltransferase
VSTVQEQPALVIEPEDDDSGFALQATQDADVEFARERLLDGWDQDMISRARVMVVGAGALGNEALKNLALLGFRNMFVIDMDTISRSNLSRSVLFSRRDAGKGKAAAAAHRTRQLCLASNPNVRHFEGDLTMDLGSGVYRRVDVVLGCLDNVAARIGTDAGCWLFGVPWVEGGMAGYYGNVTVFVPIEGPCYLCTLSEADRHNERQRFSCDQRKQRYAMSNQIPAVQTVSSIIAATQVQEALKLLQGQRLPRSIFYDAVHNRMEQSNMAPLATHNLHHPTLVNREIREMRKLSHETPLADALRILGEALGAEPVIKLDHVFVSTAICTNCAHTQQVLRPLARIWADEYQICPECGSAPAGKAERVEDLAIRFTPHREVSAASPESFQSLTLGALGIPPLHVMQTRAGGATHYVELTGDLASVLGRWG